MSRGLGILQRRVCETLLNARDGYGPSLRELHRWLGGPDRSNLHRGIEGLLRLGIVEDSLSGGERRFRLTFLGALQTQLEVENRDHAGPPRPRRATRRERERAAVPGEERGGPEREGPGGRGWVSHETPPLLRNRPPSETYKRILFVLWEYARPWEEGLPVAVVKEIVGGDRSNTRRAIRTLLLRGKLEESEDGKLIRLSPSAARVFSFGLFPPMPDEPVDDKHARAVLRRHQKKSGRAPR